MVSLYFIVMSVREFLFRFLPCGFTPNNAHHNKVSMAQGCGVRAAKDVLRKKLKKALASLSEQEKLEQSKILVRKVHRLHQLAG